MQSEGCLCGSIPVQTSNESSKSWEALLGPNATQLLEAKIKSLWTEAVNPNEKQIKNETSGPASSGIEELRSVEQTVPSWKGETKQRSPVRYDQCAHCKRLGHWRDKAPP